MSVLNGWPENRKVKQDRITENGRGQSADKDPTPTHSQEENDHADDRRDANNASEDSARHSFGRDVPWVEGLKIIFDSH